MPYIDLDQIEEKEIIPGYHARFVHGKHMTVSYWRIEAGAAMPTHNHPHEQVSNVLEGEFELTVNGEPHRMKPGKMFMIPGDVPHSGVAITDCRIMDIFYPVREDYRK